MAKLFSWFKSKSCKCPCWVDVRAYGAKGDGVTDDTAAIGMAIKALPPEGGIVCIPPGKYVIASLVIPTGVYLRGAGMWSTVLKHSPNAKDHMLKSSGNFTIEGFTIDGNKSSQPVKDGTQDGKVDTIYYDGTGGQLFLAQNNLFKNTAQSAIECVNLSGEFKVLDNQFRDFGFKPFYSSDPALVRVPLAIYLNHGNQGQILISRNSLIKSISDPQGGGIMLNAQEGNYHSAMITDNYFEHVGLSNENGSGSIDLYNFIHRTIITGNRFYNLTYAAIKVANSAELVIANNVIYKDDQEAPLKHKAAAIFHSGCVRYENCGGGPWHNVVISGNVVKDWSGDFGIYVTGHATDLTKRVHRHLISNNIIDNAKGGIELYGVHDAVLEGNSIHGTSDPTIYGGGIHILNSSGIINIRGGEIISNASYGIFGQTKLSGSDIIVQNVTLSANKPNHIRLDGASSVQISNNRFKGEKIPPIFLIKIINAWLFGNVADNTKNSLGVTKLHDVGNSWNL